MIEVFHVRNNRIQPISLNNPAEVGDTILISGKHDAIPFVQTPRNKKLHILFISPIGTIIDSDQVRLDDTGLKRIYSFPITPDLFSGTYVLQIDGDYTLREKINIKTSKNLIYRWILYYGVQITNPNSFPINNFVVDITLPPNISPIQNVTEVSCNYKPSKLVTDKEGNRWLRFYFHQINPQEKITVSYRALIITRLISYDITRIKGEEKDNAKYYPETYRNYTKPEEFLESDNEKIKAIARKYSSHTPLNKVLAFLKYVQNNLIYVPQNGDYGANYAIENNIGDCTEFASLFVSLCRSANVPARMTISIILSEYEGWVYHSQAEFFSNGIWIPIDPTLQHDFRYLYRDPSCIILQRGNTLGNTDIREVRYSYDDMNSRRIILHSHKNVIWEKQASKNSEGISEEEINRIKGTLFEGLNLKYSLPSLDLEQNDREIEIRVTAPESAPTHKPFNVPIHLYNRNDISMIGTLRISFVRGGLYTSHLFPLIIHPNSHEPLMIEIPATNFLGPTFIDFIFQDENGNKIGYDQKKINFQ